MRSSIGFSYILLCKLSEVTKRRQHTKLRDKLSAICDLLSVICYKLSAICDLYFQEDKLYFEGYTFKTGHNVCTNVGQIVFHIHD